MELDGEAAPEAKEAEGSGDCSEAGVVPEVSGDSPCFPDGEELAEEGSGFSWGLLAPEGEVNEVGREPSLEGEPAESGGVSVPEEEDAEPGGVSAPEEEGAVPVVVSAPGEEGVVPVVVSAPGEEGVGSGVGLVPEEEGVVPVVVPAPWGEVGEWVVSVP